MEHHPHFCPAMILKPPTCLWNCFHMQELVCLSQEETKSSFQDTKWDKQEGHSCPWERNQWVSQLKDLILTMFSACQSEKKRQSDIFCSPLNQAPLKEAWERWLWYQYSPLADLGQFFQDPVQVRCLSSSQKVCKRKNNFPCIFYSERCAETSVFSRHLING